MAESENNTQARFPRLEWEVSDGELVVWLRNTPKWHLCAHGQTWQEAMCRLGGFLQLAGEGEDWGSEEKRQKVDPKRECPYCHRPQGDGDPDCGCWCHKQIVAARAYVDQQIEIMRRHGSPPNLTPAAYEELVVKVVKVTARFAPQKRLTGGHNA